MQDCVKEVRDLESSYEDINALIELTEEEEDREMIKEIQREIAKFEKEFEDLRIRLGKYAVSYVYKICTVKRISDNRAGLSGWRYYRTERNHV